MNVRNFFGVVQERSACANDNICENIVAPISRKRKPSPSLRNRIDPAELPYTGDKEHTGLKLLDAERVIIKHRLTCGIELNVNAAVKSYEMVAVRILSSYEEDRRIYARLELVHSDNDLNIVLAEAECPEHLAEDWAMWSEVLNLPLRLIGLDGEITTPPAAGESSELNSISASSPLPRRFGNPLIKRRTRFQANRHVGVVGSNVVAFSPSAEIIARH
ncbi:MAG: DUF6101 family protein [Hyphomicrobiales bacterium]